MKQKLYEYALFFNPAESTATEPAKVIAMGTVIARDDDRAKLLAGRLIPKEYED